MLFHVAIIINILASYFSKLNYCNLSSHSTITGHLFFPLSFFLNYHRIRLPFWCAVVYICIDLCRHYHSRDPEHDITSGTASAFCLPLHSYSFIITLTLSNADLFSIMVLPAWKCHRATNEAIQCVNFETSLFHSAQCLGESLSSLIRSTFLVTSESCSTRGCPRAYDLFPGKGLLECFHCVATTHRVATYICAQVFMWT